MKQKARIDFDVRPLYRVTFPIAYGKEIITAGSLHRLEKIPPETIERLTERGTITEVNAPPLAVLPGWSRRASKLRTVGITNAVQMLGADAAQVAAFMRVKPDTARRWKRDVLKWLTAPENRG